MLIETYNLQVLTPPCHPGTERLTAKARLMADISEVLPYLNATLRGAVYMPEAPALLWKKAGQNVAFHPYEIALGNVQDREAAQKELDGLIALVNRTWERRDEIEPSYEARRRPAPMEVFKLLPHASRNCRQCGQPTCFTFALKLVASQQKLADCPPLFEPQSADKLAALQEIIIEDMPAIG